MCLASGCQASLLRVKSKKPLLGGHMQTSAVPGQQWLQGHMAHSGGSRPCPGTMLSQQEGPASCSLGHPWVLSAPGGSYSLK